MNLVTGAGPLFLAAEIEVYQPASGVDATPGEAHGVLAHGTLSVDVAVIEAGLGGLEDATNVIAAPTVCAITSVALDHTDVLGSSVESIARHKAGIFKAGCRAVVGPRARPAEQLRAAAEAAGCRSFTQVFCGAGASVDEENSLVAQAVLEALGEPTALEQLRGVRPVGRFERFRRRAVDVVLDGGHNPDALGRLRAELAAAYPGFRAHIVLAMSAGKDLGGALRCLLVGGSDRSAAAAALPGLPTASLHVAPSGNAARSAAAEDVCAAARAVLGQHPQPHEQHEQQRASVPVHAHASLLEAFDAAEAEAAREDRALILVCGSFNALGEVRHARLREHREGGGGGDHEDVLLDGVNMNENKLL